MEASLQDIRLGILGGGQLGKMLIMAASPWHLEADVLDPNPQCSAAGLARTYVQGSFRDQQAVLAFGRGRNLLTIEIESVHVGALRQLAEEGVRVCPSPDVIGTIQDKAEQKTFLTKHGLPTAPFSIFETAEAIREQVVQGALKMPFVQKAAREGYDGRGVVVVRDDLSGLLETRSVVEPLVDILCELSVIVARNAAGDVAVYPVVEMIFDARANLVDRLVCPARVTPQQASEAQALARSVAEAFAIEGVLAVEMFLTQDGDLLVNEVAPRPHNSGHQTIESCVTSQYEQHLRAICGLPLGETRSLSPAVMLNILGVGEGPVRYEGLEECMAIDGVKVHLYGKNTTKPFRKMGHVTVLATDIERALLKADRVREKLRVVG